MKTTSMRLISCRRSNRCQSMTNPIEPPDALPARRRRFGEGPSDIACGLMDVAFDPSRRHAPWQSSTSMVKRSTGRLVASRAGRAATRRAMHHLASFCQKIKRETVDAVRERPMRSQLSLA